MKYQDQLIGLVILVSLAIGGLSLLQIGELHELTKGKPRKEIIIGKPRDNIVERHLNRLREALPHGELYHTIPEKMKVGVTKTIVAGIAPEFTENIRKQLVGQGKYVVKKGVPFNPQWITMELKVNPEEFKEFIRDEKTQVVTTEYPGKWRWDLTPIKSGEYWITLKATTIPLNVNSSDNPPKFIIPVFEEK